MIKSKSGLVTETRAGLQTPEFVLSDASGLLEAAVGEALDFCAEKMAWDGRQTVIDHLRQGDRCAYGYFHYRLAGQAAEWLGSWDDTIRAVYLYDDEAAVEDILSEAAQAHPPVLHLIVWTRRKTGALNSMLEALDGALLRSCAGLIGKSGLAHFLDAWIVDDAEVQNSIGCGALLSSLHTRPIQIWER